MFGKHISMLAAVLHSSTSMMQMQMTLVDSPFPTPSSLSISMNSSITEPYTANFDSESLISSLFVNRPCFTLDAMPHAASITTAATVKPTIVSYPARKFATISPTHTTQPHAVDSTTDSLFIKCSSIIIQFPFLFFC